MYQQADRLAAIAAIESLEARRLLSGGVPDFGFGTDGRVIRGDEFSQGGGVIELAGGDFLVAGSTRGPNAGASPQAFLERYNPDGSLDTSFGTNGRLLLNTLGSNLEVYDLREVAGGQLLLQVGAPAGARSLVRLNADGSIDNTFGTSGSVAAVDGVLTVQPIDGKILIANNGTVRRLNADGTTDLGFGTNGQVALNAELGWDPTWASEHAVVVDNLNRVLIASRARIIPTSDPVEHQAGIVRLFGDGSVDTGWGDNGFAFINYFGDEFFSTTDLLRSSGGDYYLLINQDDGEHLVVKFDSAGVLDTNYGNEPTRDGAWLTQVDRFGNTGELTSMIFQPDGKLLLRGSGARSDGVITALTIRLNTDGTQDITWGTGGDGRVFGDTLQDGPRSLVTSDGMLLTVGSRYVDESGDPSPDAAESQLVITRYQLTTQVQPIMSVSAGGTLTFVGRNVADTMTARQEGVAGNVITVTRNGTSIDAPGSAVRRVWIDAGGGNDVVENFLDLAPTILGGAGSDRITTFEPAYIEGQAGNDTILGSAGYDYIVGGDGDDSLVGNDGNDRLFGGAGNDVLEGRNGDDFLYGDAGDDTISGGNGRDRIWGGDGNDLLAGNGGNDIIRGEAGNDTLAGLAGNDRLYAGSGNNELYGHGGNDFFYAQNGLADSLFGGSGTDSAEIDEGLDVLASIEVIL